MCHGPSLAETLHDIAEPGCDCEAPGVIFNDLAVNLAWSLVNHPGALYEFLAEQVKCSALHRG